MDADKIPDFLADQRDQAPSEAQALFLDFEDYWERKLWHQLTNSLVEFFRTPASAPQRLPIFKSFILSFADRINQLNFVSLGLLASAQCGGSSFFSLPIYIVMLMVCRRPRETCFPHIARRSSG
jgi:26S proteasome regulatory subunit N9